VELAEERVTHSGAQMRRERVGLGEGFLRELEPYRKQGYLLQEMLRPHPEIAALCGARLSTVRLIVLLEHGEPAVFHALWKIPVGANPADNFWRPGNLLAGLDAADGRVTRVLWPFTRRFRSAGPKRDVDGARGR
jgi:hypothetical protein